MKKFSLRDKNLKIVEKFVIFLCVSLAVVIAGAAVMIFKGMNLGVEFKGGMTFEVSVDGYTIADENAFEKSINDWLEGGVTLDGVVYKFNPSSNVQKSGDNSYEFRVDRYAVKEDGSKLDLSTITDEIKTTFIEKSGAMNTAVTEKVEEILSSKTTNDFEVSVVSHTIGNDVMKATLRNAIIAVSVAVVVILIYIAIRFTWISGLAAILALVHDVLIMIALTTIFQIPVNSTFIAAIITIIGYSINATIVIFDRIRELEKTPSAPADDKDLANKAIGNTLVRSLLTTVTTLVTIVALAIFGNSTIREFAIPIIFGLIAGAYSSVLLSASIWVYLRKLFKQSGKRLVDKKIKQNETVEAV